MTRRTALKPATRHGRQTNWLLIGSIIGLGAVALFGLLFLSTYDSGQVPSITDYCAQNPTFCVSEGEATAPVTLVEVMDFGCHFCQQFQTTTAPVLQEQYVATGKMRWVFLPFALDASRIPATNASLCANEQNAYFPFVNEMFAQFGPEVLLREGYTAVAAKLNLDMMQFNACLDDGRYNSLIQKNINFANSAGVSATPTFFVNGRKLQGAQPLTLFQDRINSFLP